MSDYTPTTKEVETHWVNVGFAGDRPSFRRWLAKHDAGVAASALDEVAGHIDHNENLDLTNQAHSLSVLRIRAAEYRKTEAEVAP